MKEVDLNCDLGESFGTYSLGMDKEVLKYVSSANIACGWHAGDSMVMEKTMELARENNVSIGVHPGYPDLVGFGRRNMSVTPEELKSYVKYQIGALSAFAKSKGVRLRHVKPHGAMYNTAAKDYNLALAIAKGIKEVDKNLIFMGMASSEMLRAGRDVGLKVVSEVFADRGYNDDGTLVPRSEEGAIIHDKEVAIKRVLMMVEEGKVETISGKMIEVAADSICVHGDNPSAIEFTSSIRKALEKKGIRVSAI